MKLIVHPLAVREIHKAADRHRKISRELEDRFTQAVEHALERVRAHPEIGPELARGVAAPASPALPYKLIYRPRPRWIFIVSLAHQKRREGYWRRRREPPQG